MGRIEIFEVGDGQVRGLIEWMIVAFLDDLIEFEFDLWFQVWNQSDKVLILHLMMIVWTEVCWILSVKLMKGSIR